MKKVGILTFHRAINYGAVLQTYGLCEAIKELGAEPWVIDYRCPVIENYYYKFFCTQNSLKQNIKSILFWNKQRKRNKSFAEFVDNKIQHTELAYTTSDSMKNLMFDAYIVGSDQVWNYGCTAGDKAYLFDFINGGKKYSYAASLGKMNESQLQAMEFPKYLESFAGISTREEDGGKMVEDLTGRKVEILPDPTVLVSKSIWENLAEIPIKEKYVFVYSVNMPQKVFETAKKVAAKLGVTLVAVTLNNKFKTKDAINLSECSPETFLGLIKNAEFVVTNSFHGTIFSIIFEKQFMTVLNESKGLDNSRLISVLNKAGLAGRASENIEISEERIDYGDVSGRMETWRQKGLHYLKHIIEEES